MNRLCHMLMITLVFAIAAVASMVCSANSEDITRKEITPPVLSSDPVSEIYYKQPSKELELELKVKLADHAKKYPLDEENEKDIRKIVTSNRPFGFTMESKKRIAVVGLAAITALAKLAVDKDPLVRQQALMGFSGLGDDNHSRNMDTASEAIQILICRRALYDKESDVRYIGNSCLFTVGKQRPSSVPDGVKIGLEYAAKSDPDPRLRALARHHLWKLRLGPAVPGDDLQ